MNNTKRIVIISLILCIVLGIVIFAFCNRSKKTICLQESNQKDYKLSTKYKIYSKKDIVLKVVSNTIVDSSSKKQLNEMKKYYNKQYKSFNEMYSGYDYDIVIKKNKLYSNVTINYKKYDMKKFIYYNGAMKDFVNDKKQYTLEGAIKYYKSIGASCS